MPHSTPEKRRAWAKTYVPPMFRWSRWEQPGIGDPEKILDALSLMGFGSALLPKDIARTVDVDVVQIHFLYEVRRAVGRFLGDGWLCESRDPEVAQLLAVIRTPTDLRRWRQLAKHARHYRKRTTGYADTHSLV